MSESVTYIKTPVFNGEAEEWPFYKAKMKGYLAKCKLTKILTWKGDIKKDDFVWAKDCDAEKRKEEELIQKQNIEANGILLQSINTETEAGKAAFYQVEKFMNADAGYAGGHFPNAWEALCKRYDEKEVIDVVDMQQEYFDLKMKDDERPSEFIVRLERMRMKLKDLGYNITDKEFLKQVLAKLPEGDDGVGPYQVERGNIELRMKVDNAYDLTKMTNDLEKLYKKLHKDEENGMAVDKGDDKAFATYGKQFKGMCYKCGKYGHQGKDCRDGGEHHKFDGKCFYCGKKGHKVSRCYALKKRNEDKDHDRANFMIDGDYAIGEVVL